MLPTIKERYVYLFLVLAAIAMNFAVSRVVAIDYHSDGLLYNGIAKALLVGESTINQPGVRGHGGDIGAWVMPGYSVLIAAVYAVVGERFMAVILMQVLLSIASCLLFYRLAKQYMGQWLAGLAALWLVGYVELWKHNFQFLMETSTAFLLLVVMAALHRLEQTKSLRSMVALAVLMGVLVAVNNRFIFHGFTIGCFFLVLMVRGHTPWQHVLAYGSLVLLILLPWHIRQYNHYDEVVLFSPKRTAHVQIVETEEQTESEETDKFLTYEEYVEELSRGGMTHMNYPVYIDRFTPEKFEAMKAAYKQDSGLRKYTSRFVGFFELVRTDFRFGFGGNVTRIMPPTIYGTGQQARMLFNLVMLGTMFLALIPAMYFAFRNGSFFFQALTILFWSHVVLHALVHYYYRYRVTIIPVLFLLGWYGIDQTWKWYKARQRTTALQENIG